MKYPKLREIKYALYALVTKPFTTGFPFKPYTPCVEFRGKPYLYEEDCVGCTACVSVCPAGALSFKDVKCDGGYKRVLKINWNICIGCGQCQLNCLTEKGIILSNEYDMSTTENKNELFQMIEKEMVACECCDEPIACRDHLQWTVNKLGPLYTSNTSLITFKQRQMCIASPVPKSQESLSRSDRFRLLCPQCRRESVFSS